MADVILEQESCPTCGHDKPAPADGRWRWARGGKVHESVEVCQVRCDNLAKQGRPFEYRVAVDEQGRVRIATRRFVLARVV